jgi:hypothetical protein
LIVAWQLAGAPAACSHSLAWQSLTLAYSDAVQAAAM